MNGTEQRQRRTAVLDLESQIANASALIEEFDTRQVALARIVEAVDRRLSRSVGQLQARTALLEASTLWQRLRWIAVGRT